LPKLLKKVAIYLLPKFTTCEFVEADGGRSELAVLFKTAPRINSVDDVTVPERLQSILSLSFLTK
jgi:hypothetical protein